MFSQLTCFIPQTRHPPSWDLRPMLRASSRTTRGGQTSTPTPLRSMTCGTTHTREEAVRRDHSLPSDQVSHNDTLCGIKAKFTPIFRHWCGSHWSFLTPPWSWSVLVKPEHYLVFRVAAQLQNLEMIILNIMLILLCGCWKIPYWGLILLNLSC